MSDEWLKIIYLLALGQGILISVSLFFQRASNTRANNILAIYILCMLLPLWEGFLLLAPEELKAYSIPRIFWILPWFYGPLMYLYIKAVCDQTFQLSWTQAKHFLFVLYSVIILLFLDNITQHIALITVQRVTWALVFIQMFSYIGLCFKYLSDYQAMLKNNYSDLERRNIIWLSNLLIGFVVLFLLDMSVYYLQAIVGFQASWYFHSFVIAESVYIFLIGFLALKHPTILPETLVSHDNPKYENSSLTPRVAERLASRLKDLMESEELYLDNDLKLNNLASRLNVNSHHLSQVINDQLGVSFYELINNSRIEKAKCYLQDPECDMTILDIAFAVGFNNKTSFNNAFKKYVGMTPSQFRNQIAA